MKGVVMRSTGSWYDVLTENNNVVTARMRGKFRLEGIKETNPVAVGDHVMLDAETNEATIVEILDRENYMVRQSVKKANQAHVIAANIDQAMIMATLKLPRTSVGFIDRFLVAAESFRIPQVIIFNKKDLLDEDERQEQADLIATYRNIGVTCIETSVLNNSQEQVRELLEGKVTLLSGHSGVGKSTLLNKIAPEAAQKTSEISDYSEKGTHTTTFAEMFRLNDKTFIIDTPGIKEFGLIDMSREELSDYFPEMRDVRLNCKFGARCLHLNEPKCAVLDAVSKGEIAETRYASYYSMVMGEDNRK
ncbi:MAG TPA: ribosome small subunit-dependent GTPase A [Cyclobacteriaceae bacterium]|nr:ribosome small subunit-dependent GTPase A [Cyclobacteriaceae bacterium]HMV09050.1 ribosome small subunit-dependent GTPase A [Cyclobacteriaceae bacterium]HMV89894.1 ribosome small subunit-dependent GTPase A [Cyclobacteriaceae bacterium]HMW99545.1 ribosome small subunit-dependent GTPase A [Cyclobacteriaceae bacterium]HMX51672.1 ribosome small subunit-dependent GTPase A [Cyclobacteriaceae bacterium]